MKNVHLLLAGESYLSLNCSYRDLAIGTQVGKPYWTYSKEWKHHLSVTDASVRPHNIYITSNEEIKEGDWVIFKGEDGRDRLMRIEEYCWTTDERKIYKMVGGGLTSQDMSKKIILTTDQDLIKCGVQPIDDEFLEWFVKNPSCEEVEINYEIYKKGVGLITSDWRVSKDDKYKIVIPKEEPKQETLEEVAEKFSKQFLNNGDNSEFEAQAALLGVKFGAKWQAERMYSEKEVLRIITTFKSYLSFGDEVDETQWFEQFKKK